MMRCCQSNDGLRRWLADYLFGFGGPGWQRQQSGGAREEEKILNYFEHKLKKIPENINFEIGRW